MTATPVRLDALLRTERATAELASRLIAHGASPEMQALLAEIRYAERWACDGLARCVQRVAAGHRDAGGVPDGLVERVMAAATPVDRLRLLNREQRWALRRLDGLLAEDLDADTRAFLHELRAIHVRSIERCQTLVAALDRDREVQYEPGP